MYQEVPDGYLRWAIQETKSNPNSHEELVRLATWGKEDLLRRAETPGTSTAHKHLGRDPEALALIPPPPARKSTGMASSSEGSWTQVKSEARSPGQHRSARELSETDITEEEKDASEQIRDLEAQIASLKKKQNKEKGGQ